MGANNEIKLGEVNEFLSGLYFAFKEGCGDKENVAKLRSCLERMKWLPQEKRQKIYSQAAQGLLDKIENQVAVQECAMSHHTFTPWEEVEVPMDEIVENFTGDGTIPCEPWELPDALRTYVVQQTQVPRWECHCTRCGKPAISYVDPNKMDADRQAELIRRLNNDHSEINL